MSGDSPTPANAFAKLGNFKPKSPVAAEALEAAARGAQKEIDQVAQTNGFPSREAAATSPSRKRFGAAGPKRQLNIKCPHELHDRYYSMAEERGHTELYKLLAEALDALQEKEARQDKSGNQ